MTDAKETQNNAISLLKKDHQKVKQAFAQYESYWANACLTF